MNKHTYSLNNDGYVTTWLISGPLETPVDPATRTISNQDKYEYHQRMTIHDDNIKSSPEKIDVGIDGIEGMPWRFYPSGPNCFVDVSKFYFVIYKCEFWCATSIISPKDQNIDADIWNYPSYDAWLNGEHISSRTECQYAPMKRNRVTFSLKKGENIFFLRAQNACTRDTRNIVALSFPGKPDITVAYPGNDTSKTEAMRATLDWLYSIKWNGEKIIAPCEAPQGTKFTVNGKEASGTIFEIDPKYSTAKICAEIYGLKLERKFEFIERMIPAKKIEWKNADEARKDFIDKIVSREIPSDTQDVQWFYNIYAKLVKGIPLTDNDVRIIRLALSDVDVQKDCSDFRFSYILASVKKGLFPDYLVEEVHKSAVNYSYWPDEKGIGAMCYGSENHALLFHTSQMLAGMLWPNDLFVCSGRTGKQQYDIAKNRIDAWLTAIENNGYKEFMSGGYSPITAAAMLLVIDFAEENLSVRCSKLLDEMFYSLAHNTFDGIVYAPQGRIYRGVLFPWREGTQSLIYYATGTCVPNGIGAPGSWLAAFADTKYKFPSDLEEHIHQTGMYYGKAEGTKIQTYKGKGFLLTSLPIEMVNGECFGKYKPGAAGYQQHLSTASLGGQCIVYPQHPGGPYDGVSIRPGYWYGNGYFPAQKQWDNVLGQVFPIGINHPMRFTHLYFPTRCFDEWEHDGQWLFGKRNQGYVAVWCSNPLSLYDGDISQGCDWYAEQGVAAYLTVCGDTTMNSSFDEFKKYAKDFAPKFDRDTLTLTTSKGQSIGNEFVGEENILRNRITF